MEHRGLTEVFVKEALRHPGCPVCSVCRDAEARFLRFLLRENVNDLPLRVKISKSLGFCRQHSWQLLNMEMENSSLPLGTSIIYEDLVNQVIRRIDTAFGELSAQNKRGNKGHLLERFRRKGKASGVLKKDILAPLNSCMVCESSDETGKHTCFTLVTMLNSPDIQEMYRKSDGICLPHLSLLFSCGADGPGIHFLIESTLDKLRVLRYHLSEFKRKQHWHHRDEKVTEDELSAARRAVTFFTGSEC